MRFGMPAHVGAHVTTPGLDHQAIGLSVREHGLEDLPGDAAPFEGRGHLGVHDSHHAVREAVIGTTQEPVDRRFEARGRGIVPHFDRLLHGARRQRIRT